MIYGANHIGMKRKILVVVVVLVLAIAAWIAWNAVFEMGKHEDKLWLHRCNSMEKLREKIEDYPNVEIDVVYRDNGIFDVTHDADTTFKLPLDSFFNYMSKSDGHMWLDVKNLNGGNADEMLDDLDSLTSEYGIEKGQLIVESRDWRSLDAFTDEGYYTSMYVDFPKPSKLDEEEIDSCLDYLNMVARTGNVRALSFPGWWYDDVSESVDADIDLLTWKHRTTQLELVCLPEGREMLDDERLKVVLVKSKGDFHR